MIEVIVHLLPKSYRFSCLECWPMLIIHSIAQVDSSFVDCAHFASCFLLCLEA